MEYRLNKTQLLDTLRSWAGFLKRKVHLIVCGGTALTLMGVKESTKDVDLIIPNLQEYDYLIKILRDIGYKPTTGSGWAQEGDPFIFDLFRGKEKAGMSHE